MVCFGTAKQTRQNVLGLVALRLIEKYGNKDSNLIEKLYLCADKDLKTKSVYEKNIVYHGFDSRFVGNDNDGFVP